jgi:plasmid stabilization system protein ParE
MQYQPPTLTKVADRNRLEIALYYDLSASPERADRFLDAVERTSEAIHKNPYLGRVYEENGDPYDGENVRRIGLSKDRQGSTYPYFSSTGYIQTKFQCCEFIVSVKTNPS